MAVSKALRDASDISLATKARVLAEARRQNYVPNRAAQNLRLRRTGLLGIVVPQISQAASASLVWGLERQAEALGLQVLISHSLDRPENELREVQRLIARQIEALFILPAERWENRLATLEFIRASGVPTILLESYPAGAERFPKVSWVVCDDPRGGEIATAHLLDLGHRNILFLAGPNGSSSSAGRFSGYQKALSGAGIAFSDSLVFLGGKDIESGRKAMAQALEEKPLFTAIVAHNDLVAIGAAGILEERGISIPGEVSLVGFGNDLLAEYYRVPLTTVRLPHREMGEKALRLALEMQKGGEAKPRTLPVEIVVRQSTGKRPS